MPKFPEEEVRDAVLQCLKAREVTDVQYDTVAKGITVEYTAGNYGSGRHDGRLEITDDGLKIYDLRETGKYLLYGDELPAEVSDLGYCLKSANWDIHWDGEE